MRKYLLRESGKRFLSSVFLCCLWAAGVPAAVNADPAFGNAVCTVQMVNTKPVTWQIKGTGSVTGLPNGTTSVMVTVTFEKKANGAANWKTMFAVTQTTTPVTGTATIDTGFLTLTPAPAQGDSYRILLSGTYIVNGKSMQLTSVGSLPVTPIPAPSSPIARLTYSSSLYLHDGKSP